MKRNHRKNNDISKKAKGPDENATEKSEAPIVKNSSSNSATLEFCKKLHERRISTAKCITEFPFEKKRVRILTNCQEVSESRLGGILYWMNRDVRVQDNWAFLFAQKLAFKLELPLFVAFCLVPHLPNTNMRNCKFLMEGLKEVEKECRELNIHFSLLLGSPEIRLIEFVEKHDIGLVVCDFSPLRHCLEWVEKVKQGLPSDVPLSQVDAHNIVPVWKASDKQEYSARTIRMKINKQLNGYLTEFPALVCHPYQTKVHQPPVDWKKAFASLQIDLSVKAVDWAKPGYVAACAQLEDFCRSRLSIYSSKRNNPTLNATSNLSPWLNFGQISAQRCVLEVSRFKAKYKESVDAFCEEAIIRRELADNFCFYNKNYDSLQVVSAWAHKTLNDHRKDKRNPAFGLKELEKAESYDDLWNSAQLQLVHEGKMHGFLRMYWAKKILEWTKTPEDALEIAIFLNDKYSLDGRDPNGYVGCMWSIGGIHDHGWAERPIFGKIRYMNYEGCKRKFDVSAFVARYGKKIALK